MKQMKINKDLVDAVMMVSFILLVLIGTSEFSDTTLQIILMGGLGILSVVMIIMRIIEARQNPSKNT
jgi:hypothetical protein